MSDDDRARASEALRRQAKVCLSRFREGTLKEADLRALSDLAESTGTPPAASGARQGLLYLQATTSHPYSGVIGMSIYEDGKDPEGVDADGKFLYPTIRAALEDGW